MVKIYFIFFSLIPITAFCQNDSLMKSVNMELVLSVESWPEFDGNIWDYVKSEMEYPYSAVKDSVEGTVFVQFIVDTVGITKSHHVIKSIRDDLDKEALRISRHIVFKKPAIQKGKPVEIKYIIPIEFRIKKKNNYNF